MSLGINLIDKQHKELLNIINLLASSINESSLKKDLIYIIDKLIDYAYFHFTTEEEVFDKVSYKDSKEHKKRT